MWGGEADTTEPMPPGKIPGFANVVSEREVSEADTRLSVEPQRRNLGARNRDSHRVTRGRGMSPSGPSQQRCHAQLR